MDRDDAVPAPTIDNNGSGASLAGYGPLPAVPRTSLDFRCEIFQCSSDFAFSAPLPTALWCYSINQD